MTPDPAGLEAAVERAVREATTASDLEVAWQELRARQEVEQSYARHALTLTTLRVDVPPGRVPDCARCQESCCQGPHLVSLRIADCARLVDAGLEWAIRRPGGRASVYRDHPELRRVEARPAFRFFSVLAQSEAGTCVFLDDGGRCSIYPIRPAACRAFPYRIDDRLDRVRLNTGCTSLHDRGNYRTTVALVRAAVDLFNEKVRDLLLLEHGRARLEALGLDRWLLDFARVLQNVADHPR